MAGEACVLAGIQASWTVEMADLQRRVDLAFAEHGSLRDWTLPVSAVWNPWHHRNRCPVDEFQDLPADNWSPLYGADEFLPETSVDF